MAGDDHTSEEFARQYDAAAQEAVDGLDDVVDAFATLCGLTGQSHRNHRRADAARRRTGIPRPTLTALDFQPGTVDVGSVRLAVVAGRQRRRPAGVLERDPRPPRGLRLAQRRHRPAARRGLHVAVGRRRRRGAHVVLRLRGRPARDPGLPEVPLATQAVRDLRRAVLDLASALRSVGDACDEYAATVEEHRAIIDGILADLAVEAGLTLAAGAVVGFFTFGGGAAAGGAIAGWRIASAAKKVLTALRALEALAKARAVARLTSVVERVRPLRKVLDRLKSAKRLRKGGKPAKPGGKVPHHKPPRRPGDPLDPATRPPTAGADWEGRVTSNGKGDIWQRPGREGCRLDPHHGADERYPYGYVIFTNSENQPINLPGSPEASDMHIAIDRMAPIRSRKVGTHDSIPPETQPDLEAGCPPARDRHRRRVVHRDRQRLHRGRAADRSLASRDRADEVGR